MNKLMFSTILLTAVITASAYQSYVIVSPDESRSIVDIPQEMKDLAKENLGHIRDLGYVPMYSTNAKSLMSFKDKVGTEESLPDDVPTFATLRLNTKDFDLSFPFNGFPNIPKDKLIGFVPTGSYIDETGEWTGLTAYFKNDSLGVCRVILWDLQAMDGQSIYDAEQVNYEINKKPTFTSVHGNPESGFFYEASWTGKRYEKMLKCANDKPFERKTIRNLIVLAKKIDNDLPDPAL
jgi:hypothetical protein